MTVAVAAVGVLLALSAAPAAISAEPAEISPPCLQVRDSPLGGLVGSWTVEWRWRTDRVIIDSEHGSFARSTGSVTGDSLVFDWQPDLGSRTLRTRHWLKAIEASSFTVEFFMSPRTGAPWELVHQAHYRQTQRRQ